MITQELRIKGMTCLNCQQRIEKKLKKTVGVKQAEVSYVKNNAKVTYDPDKTKIEDIIKAIDSLGYEAKQALSSQSFLQSSIAKAVGAIIIIIALFFILEHLGFTQLFSGFQLAEPGMGYGFIFVLGLITSLHCIAMCGGINLSQSMPTVSNAQDNKKITTLRPALLYNSGRIVSYTIVGAVVGAIGLVLTPSGLFRGIVQIAAGVFMVIIGLNMLGIIPGLRKLTLRLPQSFTSKLTTQAGKSKSPLIVGLLNGLMPCGPLQAMQLFALSTGSPFQGALAMFLFSLGTVPLMFGLSAFSSLMSVKFRSKAMMVGAVLVAVLGLSMFSQGLNLSGVGGVMPFSSGAAAPVASATSGVAANSSTSSTNDSGASLNAVGDLQEITSTLSKRSYPAITVKAGIPVKWVINAEQSNITGCNGEMVIPEYDIEHKFVQGDNVIEFTPTKAGVFKYSCWMGMITSTITVVE